MPDNGSYGQRGSYDERPEAETNIWQEPNGYWSARVTVCVPPHVDWRQAASAFHDAGEAMEWARQQILMALEPISARE